MIAGSAVRTAVIYLYQQCLNQGNYQVQLLLYYLYNIHYFNIDINDSK